MLIIPAMGCGTIKALIPLCFFDLSVVAKTIEPSASGPLVIQALVPFSVHPASLSCATVDAAPASLPFPARNVQLAICVPFMLTYYLPSTKAVTLSSSESLPSRMAACFMALVAYHSTNKSTILFTVNPQSSNIWSNDSTSNNPALSSQQNSY